MSCPWAKVEKSELVTLEEIISEEFSRNFQINEEKKEAEEVDKIYTINDIPFQRMTDDDFGSVVIPQLQFDKEYEYDDQLESVEKKCSGSYIDEDCKLFLNNDFESDSEEEEIYIQDEKDWDTFDLCVSPNVFKKNKKIENEKMATVGGGKDTSKLSSKVFNSLELPSYEEKFIMRYKVHRDKQKCPTPKLLGIDPHAWCLIRDMIKDKILYKVVDVLSFGREAVILRAIRFWPEQAESKFLPPPLCMIKVFKMNFKLEKPQMTACQKAEKEAANYKRLKAAGVPCLDLITQKEHVLVLVTYYNGILLKDLPFSYDYTYIYDEVKTLMKKLYEANFIHPGLSERHIVWACGRAYIINIRYLVERNHKHAFSYLYRDCTNIFNFFNGKMWRSRTWRSRMEDPNSLFKYITGYSFLDKQSLFRVQEIGLA